VPITQINVKLPQDRSRPGVMTVTVDGSKGTPPIDAEFQTTYRCLGKSDEAAAIAHDNPSRDPLRPFGDIPTGEYEAVLTVAAKPSSKANLRSYGASKRFVLNPKSGDALKRQQNGGFGIMLHEGALGEGGALRPTHGCLRDDQETQEYLVANYEQPFPVVISEDD